jgi:hypothetical protein
LFSTPPRKGFFNLEFLWNSEIVHCLICQNKQFPYDSFSLQAKQTDFIESLTCLDYRSTLLPGLLFAEYFVSQKFFGKFVFNTIILVKISAKSTAFSKIFVSLCKIIAKKVKTFILCPFF